MKRDHMKWLTAVTSLLLSTCGISPSFAGSFGLNFVGGQHTNGPDGSSLMANELAGVIPQLNWNNVAPWSETMNVSNGDPRADGTAMNLVDDTGQLLSGVTATWESDNTYAGLNPAIDNPDEKLMDGYIDISGQDRDLGVDFTGIPYPSYDVYVYVGSDGLFSRRARVRANDDESTDTFFIANTGFGQFFNGPADYVQATANTAEDAFESNYVFYQGLVGEDLSIKVEGINSNAGIHAVQLVESFDVTLLIDRNNGQAELRNDSDFDIDLDLYEIRSPSGALNPNGFFSLQDQDYEGNGAPGNGNGWEELGVPSESFLGEGYLTGSSVFQPGTVISIGDIFDPGSLEDVTLRYHNATTGVTRNGIIQFCDDCIGGQTPGDFNMDGSLDCADIDALVAAVANGSTEIAFDLDGDGQITMGDVDRWLIVGGAANESVTGGNPFLPGDGNLDGVVDVSDFNIWNGRKFTSTAAWCSGDFNADGVIDVSDFNIWNGRKFTSSSDLAVVPEPSRSLVILMGLAFLRFVTDRRIRRGPRKQVADSVVSLFQSRWSPMAAALLSLHLVWVASAQSVIFSENFDNLALGPAVDENTVFLDFWTPDPPANWIVDNSQMPGGGVTEWRGWTFADPNIWSDVAGDQRRSDFTRGSNVVAVADPDEWDDLTRDPGRFNSFLTTPSIDVSNLSSGKAVLGFDSSWRPECCDDSDMLNNQTGIVSASFDVGGTTEILRWDSDTVSPTFKDIATNERVTIDIDIPVGAASMSLSFGMTNAENDWWWAIDNLSVTDGDPTLVAEFDRATGEVRLVNGTPFDVGITGYAIKSLDGALNPSGFQPLASSDAQWIRLSGPEETQIVAEGHLNVANIPSGASLSLGNAWSKYFREESDLSFEYLDENNNLVEAVLRFDEAAPGYLIGDFNFDGQLDASDWPLLRDNYGDDNSDLLIYDAYIRGDINRDGFTDLRDFLQFKDAFDAANGAGAFDDMLVPEPGGMIWIACAAFLAMTRKSE